LKKRLQISIVNYSNTLPFFYGIENAEISQGLLIWEDYPSLSAQRVLNEDVDIALVPVGVLPKLKQYNIFGKYCIGAHGKVDSVILFSNTPIEQIKKVKLDYQSTTSNLLLKILCKEYWQIKPEFITTEAGYETQMNEGEGALIIGDRAFSAKASYKYQYDLSEAWLALTGLPFVFAVWINISEIDQTILDELNFCFEVGVGKIAAVCAKHHEVEFDLYDYLQNKIDYRFDKDKQTALNLYLDKIKNL
jgi:chorismate dehydratase